MVHIDKKIVYTLPTKHQTPNFNNWMGDSKCNQAYSRSSRSRQSHRGVGRTCRACLSPPLIHSKQAVSNVSNVLKNSASFRGGCGPVSDWLPGSQLGNGRGAVLYDRLLASSDASDGAGLAATGPTGVRKFLCCIRAASRLLVVACWVSKCSLAATCCVSSCFINDISSWLDSWK